MSHRTAPLPGPSESLRLELQAKALDLLLCAAATFVCHQPSPESEVWLLLILKDAGFLLTTRAWSEVELNLGPEHFATVQAQAAAPCAPEERRVLLLKDCTCGGKHFKLLTVNAIPIASHQLQEVLH